MLLCLRPLFAPRKLLTSRFALQRLGKPRRVLHLCLVRFSRRPPLPPRRLRQEGSQLEAEEQPERLLFSFAPPAAENSAQTLPNLYPLSEAHRAASTLVKPGFVAKAGHCSESGFAPDSASGFAYLAARVRTIVLRLFFPW